MAFFEIRQYEILPGKMEAWLELMHSAVIPFQVAQGMVICGSFCGEEDDSVYIWIRRFENEAERIEQYEAVYKSDYWLNDITPKVSELVNRETIKVQRVTATRKSTLQ